MFLTDGRGCRGRNGTSPRIGMKSAARLGLVNFISRPRGTSITMFWEAVSAPQMIATSTGRKLMSVEVILDKYLSRTPYLAEAAISLFRSAHPTAFANWPSERTEGKY